MYRVQWPRSQTEERGNWTTCWSGSEGWSLRNSSAISRPGARVLEIGGGSGFQAAILSSWGCQIQSIDVSTRPDPSAQRYGRQYFPVTTYDGRNIPFNDSSFDIVYSSHALYHAVPMDGMLAEIRRVLRPGGLAIHILPSASWRFWTTLAHYPNLARKLLTYPAKKQNVPSASGQVNGDQAGSAISRSKRMRMILTVRPLGPHKGVVEEWKSFRKARWRREFQSAGFSNLKIARGPLFYTGYLMAPGLPLSLRSSLAIPMGPASFVYSMQR